jgi:four helix bundle protein
MPSVRSFRDLIVWQRSMELCTAVYGLTREFPREEIYGLSSQMRRAAVSVASNIAEGHGRGTTLQLMQFLRVARGSSFEVQTQIQLARNVGYGASGQLDQCDGLCDEVGRMLNATVRSLKVKSAAERASKSLTSF